MYTAVLYYGDLHVWLSFNIQAIKGLEAIVYETITDKAKDSARLIGNKRNST
jgi:hypothetical protein